ncbi:MFS transporter [uncultured Bradyrhizobium sp.]|uniref:MFS transporter n=1 Tax=uncultured Bradyrhizobium sp. TaxID=199684 RepID=UPI002619FCE1|nr:MFS transporter [uncultured Bradyrhizobium sp.]
MFVPTPYRQTAVLIAVCLAGVMFHLEISSVPVALPTIETALQGDFETMQWVMNAYTIACTTVLMATGALADRYGRKRVFLLSLAFFGTASLSCGLAQSVSLLLISRFLQGLGGGAMMICQIAILSHQFQAGRERSRAFAIWGLVFGVGLGLGPLVGSALIALANWRWIFLVHVPLSILTVLLASGGVEESHNDGAARLDLPGILTLSLAVLSLTYFITRGQHLGFTSIMALSVLLIAAISFTGFMFVESKLTYPMFDFSVLSIRPLSGALVGSIAMNVSFWPFNIYLPMYFHSALGYGDETVGICMLAYTLPTLIVPPLAERLSYRYHPRLIIPLGLFTIGLGFFLMKQGSATWLTILPGCLVAGVGLGITNTPVTSTITGSITPDKGGMASGIDMSARLITFAIHIAVMGLILLKGIASYLRNTLPPSVDARQLDALAGAIASGNLADIDQTIATTFKIDLSVDVIRTALVQGFDWVMLYGGIGVWLLATLSLMVFGSAAKAVEAVGNHRGDDIQK